MARLGQHSHDLLPRRKPHLDQTEFHPGSGWRIPPGLEITTPSGKLDASIESNSHIVGYPRGRIGGPGSSVTHWLLSDSWVDISLHCYRYYDEH